MQRLPFDPKDTVADAAKRKRAKRRQREDKAYIEWIHTQPCIVTGRLPVSAHHEPPVSHAGDWHDHLTVPLVPELYMGPDSRHGVGSLELFEARYGVDIAAEIRRLHALYEEETGIRLNAA